MRKRFFLSISILFLFSYSVFSAQNNTQVIKTRHWVYDALNTISSEAGLTQFLDVQPMTIFEMKYYLDKIEYENLSDSGKVLYDKCTSFFEEENKKNFVKNSDLMFFVNAIASPELYFKSNPQINWTFNYFFNDNAITFPVIIGFSNWVTIQSDYFVGKNYYAQQETNNLTNIPFGISEIGFMQPRFVYSSIAHSFKNWGFNFIIGKEGLKIGKSKLGSIVYNDTFETDVYFKLDLYSDYVKYSIDVAQVDVDKYLYLHELRVRPFKNFYFGVIEGSLLNDSFELRYLNPLMAMHSFASWTQYGNKMPKGDYEHYGEGKFCAYFCINFEYTPISNLTIYGMYAQNEMLDPGGNRSDKDLCMPDSLGGQIGIKYNIPLFDNYLSIGFEGLYTSPYLYVKQSPDWSLLKERYDIINNGGPIYTWIGSPLGPDAFAAQLSAEYQNHAKWEAGISYLLALHGRNSAQYLFSQKSKADGRYHYYPWVKYNEAKNEEERKNAVKESRNMWMTGDIEYTNTIALKGKYIFNKHISVMAQTVYSFIFNCNNLPGNFQHGIELSAAVECNLF